MADHYRGLIKSLMKLGFLFKKQGERKHEIWRNRLTDQHVMFDRDEVARSRAAVATVLKEASRPVEKPATGRAARSSRSGGRSGSAAAGRARAKGAARRRVGTPKPRTKPKAAARTRPKSKSKPKPKSRSRSKSR